jgi:hypothetical protein
MARAAVVLVDGPQWYCVVPSLNFVQVFMVCVIVFSTLYIVLEWKSAVPFQGQNESAR